MDDHDNDDWIPMNEARQLVRSGHGSKWVHRSTLIRWYRQKRISASKRGPWWWFRRSELLDLLQPAAAPPVVKSPKVRTPTTPEWARRKLEQAGYK